MYEIVNNEDRISFLPKYFNSEMLAVESMVFALADKMLKEYDGGYWQYAVTDNGSPFLFLNTEKVELTNPHGGDYFQLDGDLAGLVITSFAINYVIWDAFENDRLCSAENLRNIYYPLMDAGRDMADTKGAAQIFFNLTD